MLTVKFSTKFKKDLKLAEKQHRNIDLLMSVIDSLRNENKLEEKYRDHSLLGDYVDCRECHVEPDFILIYKIYDDISQLLLVRVGSHSDLF